MNNYLLTGNPGTGKTFLARAAAYYLCVEGLSISQVYGRDVYADLSKIHAFIDSERCAYVQVHAGMGYEDVVYGIALKAQAAPDADAVLDADAAGKMEISYARARRRIIQLCDRAAGKTEPYCVILDDISRTDAGALLGELLYAIGSRGEAVKVMDGATLTVPENVIFIFTACEGWHWGSVDKTLRRRMDYVKELCPDKTVLRAYYRDVLKPGELRIVLQAFDQVSGFVLDHVAPGHSLAPGQYVPGHGMYMVERCGSPYLIFDRIKARMLYQVLPYLETLAAGGVVAGDVRGLEQGVRALIQTGIAGLHKIAGVQKVMVQSDEAVAPYDLADVRGYYEEVIVPGRCSDHKGILESVIDAIVLNGVLPYDISVPGLFLNTRLARVSSKTAPVTYASYFVRKDEAEMYYYDTPAKGRRVAHAYYSAKAARNGRWQPKNDTAGYRLSYTDGSPADTMLYLNGIRSHVFQADRIASENNAAELFGSTYRLIMRYLYIYEENITLFQPCGQDFTDLGRLLRLEINYMQALKNALKQFPGDKAKTEFYGTKLLQLRTLWSRAGHTVAVKEGPFLALADGATAFTMDAYEQIYEPGDEPVRLILIKEVVHMTDLKDYQQVMENLGVRQMIFQGPPGTSKTFESKKFVLRQLRPQAASLSAAAVTQEAVSRDLEPLKLTEADYANPSASDKLATGGWDLVQFHPSYSYEDFIRGIEVKAAAGMPVYNSVNRIFGKIAEFAQIAQAHTKGAAPKFYLVIDEINRANLAAVFGELIYGLEYRDSKVSTPYEVEDKTQGGAGARTKDMVLGKNLYLIGTMNTADKSIDAIDYAVRRRFLFVDSPPDREVVIRCYQNVSGRPDEASIELLLFDAVQAIFDNDCYFNNEYQKSDVRIGHTFFLRKSKTRYVDDAIERFVFQVVPILREYVKDGILDAPEGLAAGEYGPRQVADAPDRAQQLEMLSDNLMLYVKEFGARTKNGEVIDNAYIGGWIEKLCSECHYG